MISSDVVAQAFETFNDEKLVSAVVEDIRSACPSYGDLLAKILVDTNFLTRYPEVAKTIYSLPLPIKRDLLDAPGNAFSADKLLRRTEIGRNLFAAQLEYAAKAKDLTSVENRILALRAEFEALEIRLGRTQVI